MPRRGQFITVVIGPGAERHELPGRPPGMEGQREIVQRLWPRRRVWSPLEKAQAPIRIVTVHMERQGIPGRLGTFQEWAISGKDG